MSLAHFTLATPHVERTAAFFERTLGYGRNAPVPANSPTEVVWLDIGRGQEMHVIFVEGFSVRGTKRSSGGTSRSFTRARTFRRSNSACRMRAPS